MISNYRQFFLVFFILISSVSFAQKWNELYKKVEFYYIKTNYDSAFYFSEKALRQAEREFGKQDIDYAASLNYLGEIYEVYGNYKKAESLYLESIRIIKEVAGEENIIYTNTLEKLANVYQNMGNYSKAEPLYQESIKIRKNLFGKEHAEYASSLNNMATLYRNMGNYAKAEPLYQEAISIRKKVIGENHPNYAASLSSLAVLYKDIGSYGKAEELYKEALSIKKKVNGINHPDYASAVNNLAGLYWTMGFYSKAEIMYLEALKIRKELLGEKNPDYATTLNNLGLVSMSMSNYEKAVTYFYESLRIRKEVLGEKHYQYAASLYNLGLLYVAMNNNEKAEGLFKDALKIRKEVFGPKHPQYATILNNLANLYRSEGLGNKAEPLFIENTQIRLFQIQNNFAYLSEAEKERYWTTLSRNFDIFNSFAVNRYKENPSISQVIYNNHINTKGLLFSSTVQIRNEIQNRRDNNLTKQYNEWLTLREYIGKLYQLDEARINELGLNIDSIENAANLMEKELSKKSDIFANERKTQQVTWKDIQKNLQNWEAAVEYIQFRYYDKKWTDSTVYYAMVVRPKYDYPIMVRICNEKELQNVLQSKTTRVNNEVSVNISQYVVNKENNKQLYKLIWAPIDSLVDGIENVYLSVSGLLNKISFDCISNENNKLLIDNYNIHYLNNTRSLVLKKSPAKLTNNTIAVFGGITYDVPEDEMKKNSSIYTGLTSNNTRSTPDAGKGIAWSYLSGTLVEAKNINELFIKTGWKTTIYSSAQANEEAFKSLTGEQSPTVIHISTHGFFFPAKKGKSEADLNHNQNSFLSNTNPLYRCGLVMAGGNRVWQGGKPIEGIDDGILTAYEVSNTYLESTDLVVLSACKTGLGEIKEGEGVYGLQRAFQVAGAKSVVMSLWQVPDKETVELMELFYTKWLKTNNKHESFRSAQLEMSKKYNPYFWAAFVMVE